MQVFGFRERCRSVVCCYTHRLSKLRSAISLFLICATQFRNCVNLAAKYGNRVNLAAQFRNWFAISQFLICASRFRNCVNLQIVRNIYSKSRIVFLSFFSAIVLYCSKVIFLHVYISALFLWLLQVHTEPFWIGPELFLGNCSRKFCSVNKVYMQVTQPETLHYSHWAGYVPVVTLVACQFQRARVNNEQ